MGLNQDIQYQILITITAAAAVLLGIPAIINVSHIKHLFDEPGDDRKIHVVKTPNLGGIGIFSSFIFVTSLLIEYAQLPTINYIYCGCIILFAVGLKDDLVGLSPVKKFAAQVFAALIIAWPGDIRLLGFYGIFGIGEIPIYFSILLTVVFIIMIVNSFNLIDGIDGLAGCIGAVAAFFYGLVFFNMNLFALSGISFALMGALIGFLYYNMFKRPAAIFMGDTGSYLIGLLLAILTIEFIEQNNISHHPDVWFVAAPAMCLAVLIIPVFDTLRVFTLRILSKRSPFSADRNHLHHRLIDLPIRQIPATLILTIINILFIYIVYHFQYLGNYILFGFIFSAALIFNFLLTYIVIWKNRRMKMNENKA